MIDATRLGFEPFLGWPILWAVVALAALAWLAYAFLRGKAWLTRGLALTLLAAALSNPSLVQEEREPLPSVAAIILDRSESMEFGERKATASAAFAALNAELEADPSLEVRILESDPGADGTNLYGALEGLMADVPRDRIAGAILITDGQVHDLPEPDSDERHIGPLHGLIVGDPNRGDRRVSIVDAPDFGIVGEMAELVVRVDDPDLPDGRQVEIELSVNGSTPRRLNVTPGENTSVPIEIERRGENVIVVETPEGREELTLANNRTAATLSGVRDRLRVLLVTGKPNQAGRVWRDLLKSDPSVDLVHFTILRPPYKLDYTPTEELALIAFPTEELFEEKLEEFDLIIFDQYERRGVITQSYLANMSRYVTEGGALFIAAGEPFAGPGSLARSPLASVLPASPTGDIYTGEYTPELTEPGQRHGHVGGAPARPLAHRAVARVHHVDQRLAHLRQSFQQRGQRAFPPLHQPQHGAPCAARAEPRQAGERGSEGFDFLRCHGAQDRGAERTEKGSLPRHAHNLHGNARIRGADIAGAGRCRA